MSPDAIAEELALTWDPDADRYEPPWWVTTWWCDRCGAWVTDLDAHVGGAA